MSFPNRGNPGPKDRYDGPARNDSGPSLPTPKRVSYFQDGDEKTKLIPELVDGEAERLAKLFAEQANPLKTTQMRRFYDDLKAIERKILQGGSPLEQKENFARNLALIKMFKAKAVYAEKRKVAPREFTQFIFDHVFSIADVKDFRAFLKVFESVVAFHRFFAKEN